VPGPAGAGQTNPFFAAFESGLRERGYVEGRNILIERRSAEGHAERYPDLATELVRMKVDVIVALAGPASLEAAREATNAIPIVMVASSRDPVAAGLVKSLARPGGNITGLMTAPADLGGKQLELLKEAVPALSSVGVLWDATASPYAMASEVAAAARSLRIELLPFEVRELAGIERALADAAKSGVGGFSIGATPMLVALQKEVADLLTRHRLPAIGTFRSQAEAGLLMTYGPSLESECRAAATFVDKILKGASPGELPVEQPTKYELVINKKSAKAIGVAIPQSLLLRADEVIQ